MFTHKISPIKRPQRPLVLMLRRCAWVAPLNLYEYGRTVYLYSGAGGTCVLVPGIPYHTRMHACSCIYANPRNHHSLQPLPPNRPPASPSGRHARCVNRTAVCTSVHTTVSTENSLLCIHTVHCTVMNRESQTRTFGLAW